MSSAKPDPRRSVHGARKDRDSSENRPPATSKPLASMIQAAIMPMESSARIRESLALAYWPRIAGPVAAAASEAESVRDGILFVHTKSSVWSHELTLYKARLLLGLNRLLGGDIIRDIVFRAQGVKRVEPSQGSDMPTAEELAAVVLDADLRAELRGRLQALITIPDDRIRHSIAVRLTHEYVCVSGDWHVAGGSVRPVKPSIILRIVSAPSAGSRN